MATWKIVEWKHPPSETETIPLTCDCGREAECPVDALLARRVLAIIGNGRMLVLDPPGEPPPPDSMPDVIRCRKCAREYPREASRVG